MKQSEVITLQTFSKIRKNFCQPRITDEEYLNRAYTPYKASLRGLFNNTDRIEEPFHTSLNVQSKLDDFARQQESNIDWIRRWFIYTSKNVLIPSSVDFVLDNINHIISPTLIYSNSVDAEGVLIFQNGKSIKLDRRIKFFKFIRKFQEYAEVIPLPIIETTRLAQSRAADDHIINGKLILSIAPEDYLKLSEETTGWTTCLSLSSNGDYRAGCLEMLSSPYTIVAYIADDTGRKYWRQLILFTEYAIIALRAYPYECEQATDRALAIIRQLAAANKGMNYSPTPIITNQQPFPIWYDKLYLLTNEMFNDAYRGGTYLPRRTEECAVNSNRTIKINYSGSLFCLECGKPMGAQYLGNNAENQLLCPSCAHIDRCYCCGEWKDLNKLIFDKKLNTHICCYCDELLASESELNI